MLFIKSLSKFKVLIAAVVLMTSMQAKAVLIIDGVNYIFQNDNGPCFTCGTIGKPKNLLDVVLGGTVAVIMLTFGLAVLILDNETGDYKISEQALLANGYSPEEIQEISKGFEMLSQRITETQSSSEVVIINSKEDWKNFALSTPDLPNAYVQFVTSEF